MNIREGIREETMMSSFIHKTREMKMKEERVIQIETIDPNYARRLLQANTNNFRKIDAHRVEHYAKDMRSSSWELTGDTIKITNGVLIDGQHRLLAVIKSGASVQIPIAWNIAESGMFVDRGKARTVAQWLAYTGIKNAKNMASAAKLCIQYEKGLWDKKTLDIAAYSDIEIINYAKQYQEELRASLHIANKANGLISMTTATAIIHLSAGKGNPADDDLINWFWSGVGGKGSLTDGDPPLALRNRLVANKTTGVTSMPHQIIRWIATKAWNKTVDGEQITGNSLRIRTVGPVKDRLPKIIQLSSDA